MPEDGERQCYNRGCGKKYSLEENKQDSCRYHPGAPFFHDAYKGWSCCKKKSVDFTEFLNTKGCTEGFHSDVKPVEPENTKSTSSTTIQQPAFSSQNANKRKAEPAAPRPDINTPMDELACGVSASLSEALQRASQQALQLASGDRSDQPQPSTICQHGGCNQTHGNATTECCYHFGVPIFHEGMKYWSCCQRKTSDFSAFLSQEGCTTGEHLWVKKEGTERRSDCRYDWHQTGNHVTLAIYAKLARPPLCRVRASAVRLCAHVVFGDQQVFELDLELGGLVSPAASSVQLTATKVEINLKKADAVTWRQLGLPAPAPVEPKAEPVETDAVIERVEAVDLSSL